MMSTITNLPDEVIIIILEMKSISLEDAVNFQSTCKRFHQITLPSNFWEMKYYDRCPISNNKDDPWIMFKNIHHEEITMKVPGMKCMKEILNYVFLMSEDKLSNTKKKEFECLLHSIIRDSAIYYFLLDEQKRIICAKLPWLNNLTFRYNFDLIFNCLKQYRFIYKISNFMKKPRQRQFLEALFIIVAEYFETNLSRSVIHKYHGPTPFASFIRKYHSSRISWLIIKDWLEDIEEEVLQRLKNEHPTHPIFTISIYEIFIWKATNDDHFWKGTEAIQQMEAITKILLSSHFRSAMINKLRQIFMMLNIQDKLLDNISERLEHYLIVITCHCILRRFGICSYLKSMFDDYICLITKIDLNEERIQINERTDENSNSENRSLNNIQIIQLMMSHFILEPSDNNRFFKRNLIILSEILYNYESQSLNDLEPHIDIGAQYRSVTETIKIAVKQPVKKMYGNNKFSIGMIVKHSSPSHLLPHMENFYHEGVIIKWYSKYDPNFQAKLFESHMFPYLCHQYKNHRICVCETCTSDFTGDDQPYYLILTENDKICYVREDHIEKCLPKEIKNMEVGRFFSGFDGFSYIPNERLAKCHQVPSRFKKCFLLIRKLVDSVVNLIKFSHNIFNIRYRTILSLIQ